MDAAALPYAQIQKHIDEGAIALWPVGATEAHGPHLPINTDVIIAQETARRAVDPIRAALDLQALVFPPLNYTITAFASPFAGTVHVPRSSTLPYVRDAALGLAAHGFQAVCLVNGHLEPAHRFALRDAVQAANETSDIPIGLADPADARFADSLGDEFKSGSCHAGCYETALVLAAGVALDQDALATIADHPVDLLAAIKGGARDFKAAGAPNAYCGAPADATKAEGEARYARLVEITVQIVTETLARRR